MICGNNLREEIIQINGKPVRVLAGRQGEFTGLRKISPNLRKKEQFIRANIRKIKEMDEI